MVWDLQSLFIHTVFAFDQTVDAHLNTNLLCEQLSIIKVPYVTKVRVKQRNLKFSLIIHLK